MTKLTLLICTICLLSGCGAKGALYLPKEQPEPKQQKSEANTEASPIDNKVSSLNPNLPSSLTPTQSAGHFSK